MIGGQLNMFLLFLVTLLLLVTVPVFADEYPPFNTRVGTQCFDPNYQFTDEPWLVEIAREIYAMGSDVFKFNLKKMKHPNEPGKISQRYRLEFDPDYQTILNMNFRTYFMWVNTLGKGQSWKDGVSEEEAQHIRDSIYDLASWLLQEFNGTGKIFCLGHWEGDWLLHGGYDRTKKPEDITIQGMIDWLNNRQRAIEQARKDNPDSDVRVYGYTEVNLVKKAMLGEEGDFTTVTNNVLPHVNVDLISYSSYDSTNQNVEQIQGFHRETLDYIASKANDSPDFGNKNVFVGEYGYPNRRLTEQQKTEMIAAVMEVNAEWGCPFTIYWQMYDNEKNDDGTCRGFWLINDKREKVDAYYTHQKYLSGINVLKNLYRFWLGRNPTFEETNEYGASFRTFSPSQKLDEILNSDEYRERVDNESFSKMLKNTFGVTEADLSSSRSELLDSAIDSEEFRERVGDEVFVRYLFKKTLLREEFDADEPEPKEKMAKLAAGKRRSVMYRDFLDSEVFALAELGEIRKDDSVGSLSVREKYWFP